MAARPCPELFGLDQNFAAATLQVLNGALIFYIMEQCSVFMLSVKKALKTKPDAFLVTSKIFWA